MKRTLIPFLAALLMAAGSCGASKASEGGMSPPVAPSLQEGNADFAFSLFAGLCRESSDENIMVSPICISSALGMTWVGARGETESQMALSLGFQAGQEEVHSGFSRILSMLSREGVEDQADPVTLQIANALWVEASFPLLSDYKAAVSEHYGAEARNMDFMGDPEAQRSIINEWVAENTARRILDLLGAGTVTTATRVVLTSAVYFNGSWQTSFNRELTRDGVFTTLAGDPVTVPFMHSTGDYEYYLGSGFQALSLPYSDGMTRMILLLPDGDLLPFEQSLNRGILREVRSGMGTREVALSMPTFEFSASYSLVSVLREMGMVHPFDPNTADFSGFTGNRDLFISDVVHKAFVKVDEEGTEAAAATGVVMAITSMPADPPLPFILDRPFVFLILDDLSDTILFIGTIRGTPY